MDKKIIDKLIFERNREEPFKYSELKSILQDDDVVLQEESNGDFYIRIYRPILETDAEFEVRKKANEEMKKTLRERRFKTFLELKKEFEDEH